MNASPMPPPSWLDSSAVATGIEHAVRAPAWLPDAQWQRNLQTLPEIQVQVGADPRLAPARVGSARKRA